jgi:hypothetical protein
MISRADLDIISMPIITPFSCNYTKAMIQTGMSVTNTMNFIACSQKTLVWQFTSPPPHSFHFAFLSSHPKYNNTSTPLVPCEETYCCSNFAA